MPSTPLPGDVYREAFRLTDMWIMPKVTVVLLERLEKDRSVTNVMKLWLVIAYKLPNDHLKKYTERVITAMDNGNLSGPDWDVLGTSILGVLSPAMVDILHCRMTAARHVPPYRQNSNCRKGDLCAFGWKDIWRRVYMKALLRRGEARLSGYELFLRMDDHKGKVPDLCEACHKDSLDTLYERKFFDEEDDIIARAVAKLAKLELRVTAFLLLKMHCMLMRLLRVERSIRHFPH